MTDQPAYASQIIQPGDVIAVGRANGLCPIGQVIDVDQHKIRLVPYSHHAETFTGDPIAIRRVDIVRTLPAELVGGRFAMDPLIEFQRKWRTGQPAAEGDR
ncbi:hypothetical protein [Polymorphospora lycopeni]|uniref:Uncharacterized protein n=1 Tax=Polymorphospora lycopeni TaxID=3140240 RepID=A0ABV5CLJ4_9ACTN